MRILYDHQVFSLQSAGGASRYYYELIQSLASARGVQTELWLGIDNYDTAYPFRALTSAQTRVLSWSGGLGRGRARYIVNELLSNVLAAFAGTFSGTFSGTMDVYHPTLYRSMPLVRARRLVATHHDCAHERFPELFANAQQIIRAKRRLYARADAIICVSESSRQDLLRFYDVDPAKTRVIHHGLRRLAGSRAAAAELRTRVPADYLLFVGSRAPYKNFNALLRAFRETDLHRSMQLVVAGGGALTAEEQVLARQLEIEGRLIVFPEITDALLAEAYAAATLLVYPSLCEGFGFPPLEAMAAGCPALVSNTSSLPEICRDAPFYFDPGTQEEQNSLAQALLLATADDRARRLARQRGVEIAFLYSWQKCAAETLTLYRECL
jgi:glycosyltransferase involved in cell wall biosynthesis